MARCRAVEMEVSALRREEERMALLEERVEDRALRLVCSFCKAA